MGKYVTVSYPAVSCTFSCTMKYLVRDCDPNTGEPDDDGYDDEYVVRNNTHTHKNKKITAEVKMLKIFFVCCSFFFCFS